MRLGRLIVLLLMLHLFKGAAFDWTRYHDTRRLQTREFSATIQTPGPMLFNEARERVMKHRVKVGKKTLALLDAAPVADQFPLRACAKRTLRLHNPKTGLDFLMLLQCRNFWCPWCPVTLHKRRAHFQAARLASLDPRETPKLRVINLVFEVPQPLQPYVRHDPRFMPAWVTAIRRTIAGAYGYQGRKGADYERACWSELGAIWNHHAIGTEGSPWPRYHPHWDILLSPWILRDGKLKRIRNSWPERYDATRERYRRELRAAFLPFAKTPKWDYELVQFLNTDFAVDWHVSPAPGKGIIHTTSAWHRVRYSCRPLFVSQYGEVHKDEAGPLLVYRPPEERRGKPRITHRVPLGPAIGQLESIRKWMEGKHSRHYSGILSRATYARAVHTIPGRAPVYERPKRGLKLKAAYERNPETNEYHESDAPLIGYRPEEDEKDEETEE